MEAEEQLAFWIDRYENLIYSICYKLTNHYFDAQDLTQETFLTAYRKISTFDGGNEQAWLCRIAANLCLDYKKRAGSRLLPTEHTYFLEMESTGLSPWEEIAEKDTRRQLLNACQSLKEPYNRIAVQYFVQEMTAREIAEQNGKNLKTIQTQIYRARGMLKKIWRKEQL